MNNHFLLLIFLPAKKIDVMGRKEVFKEEIIEIGGGERLWILMVFFQVYIPPPGFREDNMLLVIELLDNLFSLIL